MSNETRPIGTAMLVAAFLLLLGLLTLLFNDLIQRQHNPNRQVALSSDETEAVILQRNRFGHYVVSGSINGYPVEMMLDTGASDVSIPLAVAERIGLSKGARRVYQTANGPITAWQTQLDSVEIGPLRVTDVRASINPAMSGEQSVLLGMSYLRYLEFTQRGNELILRPMAH